MKPPKPDFTHRHDVVVLEAAVNLADSPQDFFRAGRRGKERAGRHEEKKHQACGHSHLRDSRSPSFSAGGRAPSLVVPAETRATRHRRAFRGFEPGRPSDLLK